MGLLVTIAPASASAVTQAIPSAVNENAWTVADALPPSGPTTNFTFGPSNQLSIMGDWNGDGLRTPGYASNGVIKVSNSLPPAGPTLSVTFGSTTGFPAVGDFDGDGKDDIAIYTNGLWQIRMQSGGIGSGGAVTTRTFNFGSGSWPFTWPVAGNWDGTGSDGIGTYNINTGTWQLRQTAESSAANLAPFVYRPMGFMLPVVGDWNADGTDSVGGKSASTWFLNNENDASATDITFTFGGGGFGVVGGKFADATPKAVNDSATLAEDSGASAVNVLGNDTDVDGGPKSIASVTQPANGTVVITGGGTGLTYAPNANYCNSPPGTSPDTFTYTLTPGGSTATVSMTVTCVDDPPVAVSDSATVIQDTGANAIGVLGNDTDVDGGPKSIASVTQPANGTVVITGGGTGLTYAPNAGYCNDPPGTSPDTFTYTLTPGGSSATVSITVTCTDDAPVAVNDAATVGEDSGPSAVAVLANDTDTDGGPKSVASVTQPANGTVVITGGGTGLTYAPDANYCNSPPGTTPDTFTYALAPGGSSATVSMTVTCSDDPPVAVDDAATVAEDSGPSAVAVLANDTDVDGGPKLVQSVTQPANGSAVVTGGGTGVSYTPAANSCNAPPGTTPDTFTYTLNGGSSATVSMTVTCVDDPPVAVNDSATVTEDSGANAVGVLGNDTDIDGGPKSVASVTQPTNGTVAITGGGTGLTYTPNANYCNSPPGTTADTFTYTLNGGSIATVSMTVTCVDDPPVAVNDSATVGQNTSANAIDVLANDTDIDGGPKSVGSVTQPANGAVTVTGGGTGVSYTPTSGYCNAPPGSSPDTFTYMLNGGSIATVSVSVLCDVPPTAVDDSATVAEDSGASAVDVLANDTDTDGGPKSIASVTQPANGTVAITGGGTGLTYAPDANYCNSPPGTSPDTFTYALAPGGSSATVSMTVTCVDDPPVAVDDTGTVGEDTGATPVIVLANDTDIDGGPTSIATVTQPANGAVAITGLGTGLTYQPTAQYCNSGGGPADTFTYTLAPGGSIATVSMTVTCAPDAPFVDTSAGALAYTENDPPTPIDPGVTVTDADVGETIANATVQITGNHAGAQDVLALANPLAHAPIVAMVVGDTITLSGAASPAAYQSALRDVTYFNSSEAPSTLTRTATFTVTDSTALPGSDTRAIAVTPANDPPTAVDDVGTADEDTTLNVAAPGVLANDTDVDPGDTKTVVALNGTGTLTQALPSGASVTINANGSYSYNPLSAFQGLSTGQSASDSFTYTMRDAANAQDTATVTLTINGISDAPTAVADSFDAIGNTGLFVGTTRPATQAGKEITGSLLANDTDPDTPQASLVAEPVTNAATTMGGTITIESDGNFTYHPDDADVGVTDTFTYRVCDASPCNSGTVANSTGTLSLPIAGQVWYVRNNEPAGGDGTSDTPFDTLAEAEAASGTGDTTFVFDGSNTTTNLDTGYAMNANERLIGESRPLSVDPDGGGPLPTSSLHPGTSGAQPTLTASNEDVIVLASTVLVDGVDVDPSGTGGGISGGAGVDAVTVQNVNVTDTGTLGTQPGIELDGTTGVNRFTGVTVTNGGSATAIGVRINDADRVLFANTATNTIATAGAKALDAASTSLLTSRWNDITVTGSGTGAIRLSSTTGLPVLGDGSGTDLSLQTTSGATAALDIASSNTVTVDSAGTDTISATGGPAMDIRNSNGSQFFFDSASSTNSAGDGVNLDTNLTAPVVINAGTISGAAGIAFDVNGGGVGGGGVVYDGAINDGSGQSVEVTGRDGGGVTFSGTIADSGDAGGGIVVSGNSAGSTSFSGASKVLNTGASNAVALSANGNPAGGHLVSFTNGGLDIDTTSGQGLTASNGTLTVGGTGNSITTGTGTALNVDTAGITAGNLNFDAISSNGSTNGVRLNTTGTTGGLNVTGTGGACATTADPCTGGTIQSTTQDAVSLTSAQAITLQRMKIRNSLGNGVRGSSVTNFALRDSVVDNNGDNAATDEAGLHFTNLAGNSEFTRTLVANSPEDNARVVNSSGTLSQLNVTDSTFRDTDAVSPGNDGLLLQADGGSITADVLGNTFLRNRANGLQVVTNATGSMDVEVDDSGTAQSTFDDNNIGVSIAHNSSGTFSYGVRDLTIDGLNVAPGTGGSASPININLASAATTPMVGKVTGNTVTNSNSTTGPGLRFTGNGSATMTTLIDANTISQVANRGIEVVARDGSNRINATISNNSVTLNNALSADAIRVDAGTVSADTTTICADIRANTATTTAVGLFGIRARQRFAGTTFILEDYAGGATDDAAVQAFLSAANNGATTSADHGGAGFTSIADCPEPP